MVINCKSCVTCTGLRVQFRDDANIYLCTKPYSVKLTIALRGYYICLDYVRSTYFCSFLQVMELEKYDLTMPFTPSQYWNSSDYVAFNAHQALNSNYTENLFTLLKYIEKTSVRTCCSVSVACVFHTLYFPQCHSILEVHTWSTCNT